MQDGHEERRMRMFGENQYNMHDTVSIKHKESRWLIMMSLVSVSYQFSVCTAWSCSFIRQHNDFPRTWHCESRPLTAIAFVVSVWPRSIYAGQFHQSFPDFCHSKTKSDTQVTHTHCRQSRTRVCHWLQFKFLFWSVSVSLTKYWLCSLVHSVGPGVSLFLDHFFSTHCSVSLRVWVFSR